MAIRGSRRRLGCGIGCGVVVLLLIVVGIGFMFVVRGAMRPFAAAVEIREELEEEHGAAAEFVPPADGAISSSRLETFLVVREQIGPARDDLTRSLATLARAERREGEFGGSGRIWKIMKISYRMIGTLANFVIDRNTALKDAGMSVGEYTFIYAVAYYGWLGHPPLEGPEGLGVEVDPESGEYRLRTSNDADAHTVKGVFPPQVRLGRDLRLMLGNQLAAVESGEVAPERQAWRDSLAGEIARLKAEPNRLPWQEGIPDRLSASLEPYRDRLEAAYSRETNLFELGLYRVDGLNVRAD